MTPTRPASTGPGWSTFSTALFLLVLALVRGNDEGWGSPLIVSLFAGAGVLLAAFAVIEQRVAEPMLPLALFRRRAFTGVQLAAFAVSGSMFALFLYLTLYLQSFLGYSPVEAGVRYLPITLASFFVAPFAGMALARVQARYLMSAGLALTGIGLALMAGLDMSSDWTALLAGFLVSGVGVGLLNPVIADVALSVVPKEQSGMAAGINDTFRQVGIAVGIAAWGAIFLGAGASKTQELAGGAVDGDQARDLVEATSSGALGPGGRGGARRRPRTPSATRPNRASCTASTRSCSSERSSRWSARSCPSGSSASARSSARPCTDERLELAPEGRERLSSEPQAIDQMIEAGVQRHAGLAHAQLPGNAPRGGVALHDQRDELGDAELRGPGDRRPRRLARIAAAPAVRAHRPGKLDLLRAVDRLPSQPGPPDQVPALPLDQSPRPEAALVPVPAVFGEPGEDVRLGEGRLRRNPQPARDPLVEEERAVALEIAGLRLPQQQALRLGRHMEELGRVLWPLRRWSASLDQWLRCGPDWAHHPAWRLWPRS